VQIRIFEDDGKLWFVVGDVMYAIGMKELPESFRAVRPRDVRVVPGTRLKALDPAGLEHLLGKRNEHESIRFLNWMRREVVRPWEKKREG
jgi:prophage antirepressor-like protein